MKLNLAKIFRHPIDQKTARLDCNYISEFKSFGGKELLFCLRQPSVYECETCKQFESVASQKNSYNLE